MTQAQEVMQIPNHEGGLQVSGKKFSEMIAPLVGEWLNYLQASKHAKLATRRTYCKNLLGRVDIVNSASTARKRGKEPAKLAFALWCDAEGISSPSSDDVRRWVRALQEALPEDGKLRGELSVATANLRLIALRQFCQWLAGAFGVADITAGLKGWKDSREHKRDALPSGGGRKLLETVDNADLGTPRGSFRSKLVELRRARDKAIIGVMLLGGLRCVEISRLCCRDVKGNMLAVLGKGKNVKLNVKIDVHAIAMIDAWLKLRREVDTSFNDDSPIFCSLSNNSFAAQMSANSVSTIVKRYLEQAGLKTATVTPHSLRHEHAILALRGGATLLEIQGQLRHSNIQTSQIYFGRLATEINSCSSKAAVAIFGDRHKGSKKRHGKQSRRRLKGVR